MSFKAGIPVLFVLLLFSNQTLAQTKNPADTSRRNPADTSRPKKYTPNPRPTYRSKDRLGDPFSSGIDKSPLELADPQNIKRTVELDTNTNQFIIQEKMGNLDYRQPTYMTLDEYNAYKARENLKDAVKKQAEGSSGGGPLQSGRLIPRIYLSPALDRIFGGNYVDIRPNGSVVLDFGGQTQQSFNPALPIRQQRFSQFLFDQQISMNLQGKVGEKLKININYDTKANFEFDNNVKISYDGLDHEILQKVEAGNVSLPVSNSLISGAQNLFGIKTTMKFGHLKLVSVASIQRGKSDKVTVRGGAQTKDINKRADDYEDNRHFFLSHFFRNNFERALANPAVTPPPSGVVINRVEVYVTNLANNTQSLRNMVAFMDLGEGFPFRRQYRVAGRDSLTPAQNGVNTLYNSIKNERKVRDSDTSRQALAAPPFNLENGIDYEVIRGARKLTDRDFTFHKELGFISLNSPLRDIEVLAVAYEYTYNGQVFKVGELVEDYQNLQPNDAVILKMLRPSDMNIHLRHPTWRLEMRNIYNLGASQIAKEGFQLRVIYKDDSSGVDNPALRQGRRLANKQLVQVFNADRLNPAGELQPDGVWDFVEGTLIDKANGRIMFPVLEPFGSFLRKQFDPDEIRYINHYVFFELYSNVKQLAIQAANKNKYYLIGKIQSSSSSEIQLQAFNIAPGSVRVSVGIRQLQEGTDFQVDYNLGKVRILDQGVLSSGEEVNITYEKSDLFNFQQRSFFGTRADYTVNKDFNIGGTLLYLNERPMIRRVAVGDEPTNNVLVGFDFNYKKDNRTITKLLDLLPFYQTKEVSNITLAGEYARLMPGVNSFVDPNGGGISYVDDFEAVRTTTDMYRAPISWKHGSIPTEMRTLYPSPDPADENTAVPVSLYNRRARLSWYSIDNIFYRQVGGGIKPSGITSEDAKGAYVRAIGPQEVYPNRDLQAINLNEITMDVAYYPEERGIYNYSTNVLPSGRLPNPTRNWGSMIRPIFRDNNFDAANVEYVEFWMMDPFISGEYGRIGDNINGELRKGKMYLQLGTMSEDIIKDGKHSFENGLPTPNQRASVDTTSWGTVTTQQYLTNAFDNAPSSRPAQDVGLDGLSDASEREFFNSANPPANRFNFLRELTTQVPDLTPAARAEIEADPSSDNFTHYLSTALNNNDNISRTKILDRYKFFAGIDGNSPINTGGIFTPSSTQIPDNEDLNNDRVVGDQERYFSYRIDVDPNRFRVGSNYIVDQLQNQFGTWYLFRIPIRDFNHPNFAGKVGGIDNFNTVRFMRLFMTGFEVPVVFRFVQFQLVASTWRPYTDILRPQGQNCVLTNDEDDAALTVGTANIEENGFASPGKVPYVVPPGAWRDRDVTSGISRRLNEQSLSLCVDRLRRNNSKAVFKNVRFDFLNYKRLRMFVHAHTNDATGRTKSGDVTAFLRLGTDFNENYYEVSVPLNLTPLGTTNPNEIWEGNNEINIEFNQLYSAKSQRNLNGIPLNEPYTVFNVGGSRMNVTIVGNPDMNACNTLMLGVRHTRCDDFSPKSLCVWFNDLRVTDFDKNQGWATTGRMAVKLADLGQFTATGRFVGIGFGGIEQKISERTRVNTYSYNLASNIALDKFTPKAIGLRLPMYVSYDYSASDPNPINDRARDGFDPLNPDVRMRATLAGITDPERRDRYRDMVVDRQERRSINFTNFGKSKTGKAPKSYPWDIENLNFTYAYSEVTRSSIQVANFTSRNYKYGAGYSWASSGLSIEPFKSAKWMEKLIILKPIQDFNLSFLPTSVQARVDLDRTFTRTTLRSSNVFGRNLDPTFEKQFFMTRTYGAQYSPFKSLAITYAANVSAIIDEPFGDLNTQAKRDTVRRNLERGGRTKSFNQNITGTYKLPLEKLPLTDWLSADYRLSLGYVWMASAEGFQDTLGNKINNSREQAINGRIDLLKLYNKIGFLKKINTPAPPAPPKPKANPKEPDTAKKVREWKVAKGLLRVLMSMRQVNVSYTINEATALPGFRPNPGFFGNDPFSQGPGWDFIMGGQTPNIRQKAADNGWLGRSQFQNQQFTQTLTENLNARTSIEPLPDFRIQLDAKMQSSASYSEIFRDTSGWRAPVPTWASLTPARTGNYSISFISIGTAFSSNDAENRSPEFKNFENYRYIIRSRLENANPARSESQRIRYDNNSQDVLIPAFLAAYTGADPNRASFSAFPKIPLPNWRIDYGGLTKIPAVANLFQTVNITHSYNSTYNVGSYTTNLQYGAQEVALSNRVQRYQFANRAVTTPAGDSIFAAIFPIGQVAIQERFSPLIGINIRTKSKITFRFDYNKDRSVTLNLNNAQIAEQKGQDFTFGVGYQKAGIKLPFRVQGRTIILANELTARLDVTLRETLTIQRQIDEINTVTQGMSNLQIKPSLNYMVNQRLSLQAYVDHTIDTPRVSTSFKRRSTRFGIQLRFSLS